MIKKFALAIFLQLMSCFVVLSQTYNEEGDYTIKGKVGVGTETPLEKLHLYNGTLQFSHLGSMDNVDILKIAESTSYNEFTLQGMFKEYGETGNALKFRSIWRDNLFYLRGDGHVGFGTNTPLTNFHVRTSSGNTAMLLETSTGKRWKTQVGGSTGNFYIINYSSLSDQLHFTFSPDGKLGIGTTTPSSKLDVKGTIKATEIKVESTGGADFVFEEDYQLKSLEEVDQFVQENKHLPDIPSAKQMEEEGVGLAEMNKLLLQKVEELMLYTIEQQKLIQTQKQQLQLFEQRLTNLENDK